MSATVNERLVAFARHQLEAGLPTEVLHEAKRLLINQWKASVGAVDSEAVVILRKWAHASAAPTDQSASSLWFGDRLAPEQAAVLNAALFEVLDFNETHIPTFQHAVSGVLPAVLAAAEAGGQDGRAVLSALAIGIEVELACATILMPSGYYRGFVPGGITGAIGGALAVGILEGLDDAALTNALGLAMNSGAGFYQSAGSMAFSWVMGMTARSGLTAARLAGLGLDAPRASFEGDKGMFSAYSDEPAEKIETVLAELGSTWRILRQSYKTVPTETITHGPIDCVFALRSRAAGRRVRRMRFGVEAIVIKIADERRERFGTPSSDLEAKFDLRHCAAAAWVRGRFTLEEMKREAFTDPDILALSARIDLFHDTRHATFDGCSLIIEYEDGTQDDVNVPAFLGSAGNRMSDDQLSQVFRDSAGDRLSASHADRILDAAWTLDAASDVSALMRLSVFA